MNSCMKDMPVPVCAVCLSVLRGWHTREGFQLLPSRRHCVCAFNHPLRNHFICNTVGPLYLHLSSEGFEDGLVLCGPLTMVIHG